MKATELRIGNYVSMDGSPYIVTEINSNDNIASVKDEYNSFCPLDEINSIPLNNEWAVKFGYENLTEMASSFFYDSNFQYKTHEMVLESKFVHEAQNLYFALTGKELEIKD